MKLKKGDKVIVITGKSRGQSGTITRALPKEDRIVIEGINLVKKHRRRTAQNRSGQIVDKPMSVHVSNVMLLDPKTNKPTRIRAAIKDGTKIRIAVKSGSELK